MGKDNYTRLQFVKETAMAGIGIGLLPALPSFDYRKKINVQAGKRIGIIGLDTSHSTEFTKQINTTTNKDEFLGYRVVAAYPNGSRDIKSSVERIPQFTQEIKVYGVEVVDSLDLLFSKSDVILLETNDGRLHLEQATEVIRKRKPLFIDKPIAVPYKDVVAIYNLANENSVPVFSSSSTRFIRGTQEIASGKIGQMIGTDTYSPAILEKTNPDLYWYGIHGIELLFTVMGVGCEKVTRYHSIDSELVVGIWNDGRIGTFRGSRFGQNDYDGIVFGEKGNEILGPLDGYKRLLLAITRFFETGISSVKQEETLEIYAFMTIAEISKKRNGRPVQLSHIQNNHKLKVR